MAKKYLDETGLAVLWEQIKTRDTQTLTASENYADTKDSTLLGKITALETKMNTFFAGISDSDSAYDTLRELIDYINSDQSAASSMLARIGELETASDHHLDEQQVLDLIVERTKSFLKTSDVNTLIGDYIADNVYKKTESDSKYITDISFNTTNNALSITYGDGEGGNVISQLVLHDQLQAYYTADNIDDILDHYIESRQFDELVQNYCDQQGFTSNNGTVIGNSLTNDYIILGYGSVNIKASKMKLASSTTTWNSNSDVDIPTMKSIYTYVNGQYMPLSNGDHYYDEQKLQDYVNANLYTKTQTDNLMSALTSTEINEILI